MTEQQQNNRPMEQQRRGGSGNFAHDPERAREAGRKGGKASR